MGRPSKLSEPRRQRILAILEAGGSRRTAASVSGISAGTLSDWLKRGERFPGGLYGEFRRQVEDAESGERHLVGMPSEDRSELQWALSVLRRDPPAPSRAWSEPIVITLDPHGPPGGWEEP